MKQNHSGHYNNILHTVFQTALFVGFLIFIPSHSTSDLQGEKTIIIPQGGEHPSNQAEILRLTGLAMDMASSYWTNPEAFAQVHAILEKVKVLQPTYAFLSKTPEQHKESYAKLWQWAQPLFSVEGVEIKDLGDGKGFGLHATKNLSKGDIFLKVPLNYTVRANVFRPQAEKCFGSQLYDTAKYKSFWTNVIYVALAVAHERLNPDSMLKPYIDSLPTQFGLATYYTPKDLSYLAGTGAFESTIWSYYEAVLQYTTLYHRLLSNAGPECEKLNFRPETFTYSLYQWAVTVALTRNLNENDLGSVLIPIWDNGNHHNTKHSYYQKSKFDKDSKGQKTSSRHGYLVSWLYNETPQGEEIYHEYKGSFLEMDEFFTSWDIINEEAPVVVEIKVLPADPTYAQKKQALQSIKGDTDSKLNISPALPNIPMFPSDFEKLLAAATGKTLASLDSKSWFQTWKFLKKRIQSQLYFYIYKPEHITELLKDASLSYISSQALRYSLAEQLSLRRTLVRLEKMIHDSNTFLSANDIGKLKSMEKAEDERWEAPVPPPPEYHDVKPYIKRDEL